MRPHDHGRCSPALSGRGTSALHPRDEEEAIPPCEAGDTSSRVVSPRDCRGSDELRDDTIEDGERFLAADDVALVDARDGVPAGRKVDEGRRPLKEEPASA